MPFGIKDFHKDLTTLHVGCEKPHAYFIPHREKQSVLTLPRDYSPLFKTLIGKWDFRFFPSVTELAERELPDVDFFEKIDVPMNWQNLTDRGYDTPQYTNVRYPFPKNAPNVPEMNPAGLYSRDFTVSEDYINGREVMLTFEGVDSCFYLFVNGEFAGYSQVSHMTSEFNVTKLLRRGKNNIKVLVLKWCDGSYLEDQDMFRASGIFREVYLLARAETRIDDVFVKCDTTDDFKLATLTAELVTNKKAEVTYTLLDKEGCEVFSGKADANGKVDITLGEIKNPKLWSDESPYLYSLLLECSDEFIKIPVGVRRIEVKDKVVYLNGKNIKARGVNRHDSNPYLGHATPMEHMRRDLLIMKAHNVNTVRTSHYPNDPRFLELCNEYGLYVIDEADMETHGYGTYRYDNLPTVDPAWLPAYLDRAERMLERDKNQPSVIIWSVGNEAGCGENLIAMGRYYKKRDPRRLVHDENHSRMAREAEMEKAKPGSSSAGAIPEGVRTEHYRDHTDIESRMYPSPAEIEECYLKNERMTRPFFLCEYCHAMGNGPGDLADYQRLIDKYDSFFGGCIWEFLDHSVAIGDLKYQKPSFVYGGDFGEFPHDAEFCVDGLVYPDRRPHTGLLEAKEAFRPFDLEYANGGLTVKSKRRFEKLSDLSLVYTVERFGKVVYTGKITALDVEPKGEKTYTLDLPEISGFSTLNISVRQNTATEWAPAGYEIGAEQFILSDKKLDLPATRDAVEISESPARYTVSFGECEVAIGKVSGLIESIISNGKDMICEPVTPIMWRAPTDNDRKIKLTWRQQCLDRLVCHGLGTEIDGNTVKAELVLAANGQTPAARISVKYVFDGNGIKISAHTEINRELTYLPRFGFKFTAPEEFEDLSYFGYGPHEAYEDKCLASRISLFKTTVTDNFEHYVRPQENSAHASCKWAALSSVTGYSLFFAAEKFSLSASHYEPHYLTGFGHDFELVPQRESTVIIDYRTSGIGSNSCGPALNEKYRISEKEFDFEFSVKPEAAGNRVPEAEYSMLTK